SVMVLVWLERHKQRMRPAASKRGRRAFLSTGHSNIAPFPFPSPFPWVEGRLASRTRLETAVRPEVLIGLLAYEGLHQGIDPGGINHIVSGGEAFERGVDGDLVASRTRQAHLGKGYDPCAAKLGKAACGRHRGGRDTKERRED